MVVSFDEAAGRLSSEALDLLRQMASAHLATTGNRFFIESRTNRGTSLKFVGTGTRTMLYWVDGSALEDLVKYGILHRSRTKQGTANYRVGSDGVAFHRYLLEQDGVAVDQVEGEVMRLVDGDTFASKHPTAAQQLREGFELLWGGRTDHQTLSEVGGHLRHAVMDITSDLVGDDGKDPERPIARLRAWVDTRTLQDRERRVVEQLVELADAVLDLDQRLTHVRDEEGRGRPSIGWEEQRRAAFTTVFVCHELSRIAP